MDFFPIAEDWCGKKLVAAAGVSYCFMLTFGAFALADYNIYGVGMMEVGTFYALCKIYLSAWEAWEMSRVLLVAICDGESMMVNDSLMMVNDG